MGLLAGGFPHDGANPLTSISSIVQMLERRDLDTYTRQKLQLVTTELARIQAILRELIQFSRPVNAERGRVAVQDVIDEALRIAKFYKGGKNRQIIAVIANDLPPLHGVRDQYVQVVFNLVLNAIDATGKGGRIEVKASRDGDQLRLAVSDDGSGIAPEHLPRLFRPYFTTKNHGTGLGLFVIRRIVESDHGTVTVVSEPGRGTTFNVLLPIHDAARSGPNVALEPAIAVNG